MDPRKNYMCPVCQRPFRAELRFRLSFLGHFRILLVLTVIGFSLYYLGFTLGVAAKSLTLYLPLWALSECTLWLRAKDVVKCTDCGFDAFLYVRDVRTARNRIVGKLNEQKKILIDDVELRTHKIQEQRAKDAADIAGLETKK